MEHPTTRALYAALIEDPVPDRMLVLADAIEEFEDDDRLAFAYRWAAKRGRWPFRRRRRGNSLEHFGGGPGSEKDTVCDWDRPRESLPRAPINDLPESCKLPTNLFNAIRSRLGDDRRYDGPHEAFILLARALEKEGIRE